MVTHTENGMSRVTVTLDPTDIDLLDRLSALEGPKPNRSRVLRSLLQEVRPMLLQTVEAFEKAQNLRGQLDKAAAEALVSDLQEIQEFAAKAGDQYAGAMARLEGLAASDPRRSNHGGHTPTPTNPSPEVETD